MHCRMVLCTVESPAARNLIMGYLYMYIYREIETELTVVRLKNFPRCIRVLYAHIYCVLWIVKIGAIYFPVLVPSVVVINVYYLFFKKQNLYSKNKCKFLGMHASGCNINKHSITRIHLVFFHDTISQSKSLPPSFNVMRSPSPISQVIRVLPYDDDKMTAKEDKKIPYHFIPLTRD